MINYLTGTLESKTMSSIVLDVNGVGYSISVPVDTSSKLPEVGGQAKIYIVEAVSGMYGGVIYLYGFLSKEDRNMYTLIKEEVPGTGAKKSMEYIDKILKSVPGFKSAIIKKDTAMLQSIFGFTKKTSDKLIASLKDKIQDIQVAEEQKWLDVSIAQNTVVLEAINGLIALGYKESLARSIVSQVHRSQEDITVENLIRKSLQNL